MKTVELYFGLFVLCQPVHSVTDMLVCLGQNVSLNCDLIDVKEIYWFMQQYPGPPKPIFRSFFGNPLIYFYNDIFKAKFSLQENFHLGIQNLTQNELGIFYCVKTGDLMFRNGIRLYVTEPTTAPPHPTQPTHQCTHYEMPLLVIISATLSCMFLAVAFVSGLMHFTNRRNRQSADAEYQYTVIIRNGVLTGCRSSTFTSVEFTQINAVL